MTKLNLDQQFEIIKRKTLKIITEDELRDKLKFCLKKNKKLKIKLGIDPTATDIHLGFAIVLRKLADFQKLGHKTILVIGDFTAKIGDPTGRNSTRPVLTESEIKKNMSTYLKQIYKILDKNKTEIKYNSKWLKKLNFKQLLTIFSKITLQKIIEREDFQKRLNNNNAVFIHEIIYPLAQAYDSLYLKADIELGGIDQELNCLMGRELQSKYNQEKQVVILTPLLIGLDGRKMSKSYGNYIAITDPPSEMFGKVMSISDDLLNQWFELCTDLSKEEIEKILKNLHPMETKKKLAYEIVKIYHNEKLASLALKKFEETFQKKDYQSLAEELIIPQEIKNLPIIELLPKLNLAKSKSEARRLIEQGSIEINYQKIVATNKITNLKINLKNDDLLRIGKKKFFRIIIK